MHKKLKVLQLIDSLSVGGAEMMAVNIANGLSKYGMEAHLCTTRAEGLLKQKINKNVKYLYLEKNKKLDIKAVLRFKKYIKKHQIDIIHAHSSSFFIAVLVKIVFHKIKIVWHDHYGMSENIKNRKSLIIKLSSFFFSFIISVNDILFFWAKEELYCKNRSFLANFASFNSTENKTALHGLKGKRIVCVAAFRPQKDHLNSLRAFKIIKNNYPDWTLHFIGQKQNGIYTRQIDEMIKNENLSDSVFFYGSCLDIKNVLSQGNIGVLSSKSEGLPVSLLEYGLAGLPVVVTDVGECKKVVNNFGLVVPKENTIALSKSIIEYIENENLRESNAKQFQKHIIENYSEKSYLFKLLNIYKTC